MIAKQYREMLGKRSKIRELSEFAVARGKEIGYENGVLGGVVSALNVLCSRGDAVLLHSPTYIGFTHALTGNGYKLTAVGAIPFSFNASRYTQEELTAKAHNYELEDSGSAVLCLDYALNGIGSNSCGPQVMDKYAFNDEAFRFTVKLIPEKI